MTDDQIEQRVARMIDHLRAVYARGEMSEKNYRIALDETFQWAALKRKDQTRWPTTILNPCTTPAPWPWSRPARSPIR